MSFFSRYMRKKREKNLKKLKSFKKICKRKLESSERLRSSTAIFRDLSQTVER